MSIRLRVISLLISFGLLLFVLDLVRRRILKERYSLLWCAMCLCFIVLAMRPLGFDNLVQRLLGVFQVPNLFFLAAIVFLIVMCIHFSVRLTMLGEQTKILAQDLALLKSEDKRSSFG